jgi:hypothetical protein
MHVPRLVIEPGTTFTVSTIVTLVTGTLVVIAFARFIERQGIGYGFWIMFAAWSIGPLASNAARLFVMLGQGAVYPSAGIVALAGDVAIFAGVVALLLARRRAGFNSAEPVVWPLVLAPLLMGWLVGLDLFIGSQTDARSVLSLAVPNNPIGFLLHALIVSWCVVRYAIREGSRAFILPTVVLAMGATLVSQFTWTRLGIQPLLGGASAVIVAAVLYVVVQRALDLKGDLNGHLKGSLGTLDEKV